MSDGFSFVWLHYWISCYSQSNSTVSEAIAIEGFLGPAERSNYILFFFIDTGYYDPYLRTELTKFNCHLQSVHLHPRIIHFCGICIIQLSLFSLSQDCFWNADRKHNLITVKILKWGIRRSELRNFVHNNLSLFHVFLFWSFVDSDDEFHAPSTPIFS